LTNSRIDMLDFGGSSQGGYWKECIFSLSKVHKMKMKTKDRKNHEKKEKTKC
jgi:hypothetical protein